MTDNNSIYTFNASRFDNQIKYECQIMNQALVKPLRVERYLHVKCKIEKKIIIIKVFCIDRPYIKILAEPSLMFTNEKLIGIEDNKQKLTCEIDANPAATSVYWTINGTNIISRM
jgi:hypothetical protein